MTTQPLSELLNLAGKTAIVTGAGSGIGQAIALRLAEAGASVIVSDIDLDSAHQTVTQIKNKGHKATAVYADAASATDGVKAVQAAVDLYGSLDILVNNAGIFPITPALQITEELWDRVLGINLKSVFFYSQAAANRMIEQSHAGKIINIASIDGFHPSGNLSHYGASKGGLVTLTRSLALEYARYGINVNAVAPGAIMTPGGLAQSAAVLRSTGVSPQEFSKAFMLRLPLGRMGEPDDVARAVLFLASSAADYMTGSIIVVDGGYLLS